MDFQEAFLALYWPAWAYLLGLFVAAVILVSIYHLLLRPHRFRRPSGRTVLAGIEYDDDD